jgi:hypothetical protein
MNGAVTGSSWSPVCSGLAAIAAGLQVARLHHAETSTTGGGQADLPADLSESTMKTLLPASGRLSRFVALVRSHAAMAHRVAYLCHPAVSRRRRRPSDGTAFTLPDRFTRRPFRPWFVAAVANEVGNRRLDRFTRPCGSG